MITLNPIIFFFQKNNGFYLFWYLKGTADEISGDQIAKQWPANNPCASNSRMRLESLWVEPTANKTKYKDLDQINGFNLNLALTQGSWKKRYTWEYINQTSYHLYADLFRHFSNFFI